MIYVQFIVNKYKDQKVLAKIVTESTFMSSFHDYVHAVSGLLTSDLSSNCSSIFRKKLKACYQHEDYLLEKEFFRDTALTTFEQQMNTGKPD